MLLRGGSLISLIGLLALAALFAVLGGIGIEGAHSNAGWLALIIVMTCLPFGLMLTALGAAKWFRLRRLRRDRERGLDRDR